MSALEQTQKIFFEDSNLSQEDALSLTENTLQNCDDGELFLEYRQAESFLWDDGRLRNASFDTSQGFGLRAVCDDCEGFAHSGDISQAALSRAATTVTAVKSGYTGELAQGPIGTNQQLYMDDNPLADIPFETKVKLLAEVDQWLRDQDPHVKQVTASLAGNWQAVHIVRGDGQEMADIRPLVRFNVSVVVEKDGRMETGSYGAGGRVTYDEWLEPENWQKCAKEALRQALVNLESVSAPAGEMQVVLGNGWPGILLHEAVGHGLEGDFNRKKTSAFSDLIGQQVAAKGVTVVDDGTIHDRRGSLTIDDEGTPTQCTTLIEDGILTGYMQDRKNARLMGMEPTGNGRRESYAHCPMPRMTNTIMMSGEHEPLEVLSSVKNGLFAVNFGGGQVDITSGKFVFEASEAYLIEDGQITRPVKGATLIGNGPDVMKRISMIGNDMKLDPGIGTCGKDGQGVPVGVGQPTLRIDAITVGGTGQ